MSPHKYEAALHVMKKWRVDIEKGEIYTRQGLSKCKGVRGYMLVSSYYEGVKYTFKQHQIIVLAAGLNPVGKQINHKDGDKMNNCIENLEIVTPSKNVKHAFTMGLRVPVNRRFSEEDIRSIRKRLRKKEACALIAKDYDVVSEVIRKIKRGETYRLVMDESVEIIDMEVVAA